MSKARATTHRLGERSNAILAEAAEALGISRDATMRLAIDQLHANLPAAEDALHAQREAIVEVERWRETFGGHARLRLRAGHPLTVRTRRCEQPVAGASVHGRQIEDGRIALDVILERPEARNLVIEAVATSAVPDAAIPLAAIHLIPIAPPPRAEVVRRNGDRVERTVWGADGGRLTYQGELVAPNRVARYAA